MSRASKGVGGRIREAVTDQGTLLNRAHVYWTWDGCSLRFCDDTDMMGNFKGAADRLDDLNTKSQTFGEQL